MSDPKDIENDDLETEPGLLDDDDLGLVDPESLETGDEDLTDENPVEPGDRMAQLEEELAVTKDRMMRLAADLENTRRRAQKEKTEAAQYGISNFARDLLSVADNFERALQAVSGDKELTAEAVAGMVNGVKMTEKELLTIFERHGVRRLYPEGEKFDPNLHQAIAHVPGGGIAQGHVVNVAQPGFVLGDRVLRAAMVTVSSGE